MNKGIYKASGEYCWFLNSGDYAYKSTTLEDIFSNDFDEDIVYGDVENKYDSKKCYIQNYKFEKIKSPIFWIHKRINHQSSFIRKHLFEKLGNYRGEKYRITADTMFFMTAIFKQNISVKYISVVFSVYMRNGISDNKENIPIIINERKNRYKELFFGFPFSYFLFRILSSLRYGKIAKIFKDIKYLCQKI